MTDSPASTRLIDLVEHADCLDARVPLATAQPHFARCGRRFLGVVGAGRFVGVASAREITELLSMQFGHALFGRAELGAHVMGQALAVEPDVPITELLQLIARRDATAFDDDVALVSRGREFLGLIPMHRLVRLQTSLLLANLAELERQRGELAERNRSMLEDLRMAREVQRALAAGGTRRISSAGRALEAHPIYEPAEHLGGDFCSVCSPRPGVLSCFVGDVMGHGVRSSLITAMLRAFLSEARPSMTDPARLLAELNTGLGEVLRGVGELIFVTAAHAVVDLDDGSLLYAQAGHPRPLLRRAGRGEVGELPLERGCAGPALGLIEDASFLSTRVPFAAGDALLLFTDGLVEAAAPSGEEFGTERLAAAFAASCADGCQGADTAVALVERARSFAGTARFADDVCVVLIRAL